LTDAEAAKKVGAGRWERTDARKVHNGWESEVAYPQVAGKVVLPKPVGAASADRPGIDRIGDGGVFAWAVHQ
jgi:hypothetical protein